MSHVDGAHQPEDQREAGRDDEHQPGKRDAVEQGDRRSRRARRSPLPTDVPVAKNSTQLTTNTIGRPTAMAGSRRVQLASIHSPS